MPMPRRWRPRPMLGQALRAAPRRTAVSSARIRTTAATRPSTSCPPVQMAAPAAGSTAIKCGVTHIGSDRLRRPSTAWLFSAALHGQRHSRLICFGPIELPARLAVAAGDRFPLSRNEDDKLSTEPEQLEAAFVGGCVFVGHAWRQYLQCDTIAANKLLEASLLEGFC